MPEEGLGKIPEAKTTFSAPSIWALFTLKVGAYCSASFKAVYKVSGWA